MPGKGDLTISLAEEPLDRKALVCVQKAAGSSAAPAKTEVLRSLN